MTRTRLVCCFLLTALGSTVGFLPIESASGQIPDRNPPSVELGAFGGWVDFDDQRSLEGSIGGARLQFNVSPYLGLETQLGYSEPNAPGREIQPRFWLGHVDVVGQYPYRWWLMPFVSAGIGGLSEKLNQDMDRRDQTRFSLGGGIKFWPLSGLGGRADIHYYTGNDDSPVGGDDGRTSDVIFTLGFSFGFGRTGEPPVRDADLDGVPDALDGCPGTPGGIAVDARGCPLDTDGDGVPNYTDACPNTPRYAQVEVDGCARDTDGDGIPDGLDQCGATLAGALVDQRGCALDGDGDGVPDGIDLCDGTPSEVDVDETGCPRAKPIPPVLVLHNITFASGSADLLPPSRERLDEVAESLRAYPEVSLEIRGFADSQGDETFNLNLTQRRAESVREHLVSRGIASERLTATGYGEADPIATNETSAGRAMNRRVELHRR